MMKITFSLIIPIYGVEKYIERNADSVLGQTYDAIQFIFVDDGTKDSSIDILNRVIEERYPHLKDRIVIHRQENKGLPSARKAGLQYASGDYILHVDSDDWLETDAVERLAAELQRNPVDILYFDFYREYESGKIKIARSKEYSAESIREFIFDLFIYKARGYVWNKCVRRSLYEDNHILFPLHGMHEDICLNSQLIWFSRSISYLKEPLYHYRKDNPTSITAKKKRRRREESTRNMLDLLAFFLKDLENSPVRDAYGRIVFRAAWVSLKYGLDYFSEYPFLAGSVKEIPVSSNHKVPLWRQVFLKLYVKLKRL